jgi:hypothetical protein
MAMNSLVLVETMAIMIALCVALGGVVVLVLAAFEVIL